MIQRVVRGAEITLDVQFLNGAGQFEDADPVLIDIISPDDVEVVSNDSPTAHPTTGRYTYTWEAPSDADLGIWGIRWVGTMDGAPIGPEVEYFEVAAAGSMSFTDQILCPVDELAAYLGESIESDDERALLALGIASANVRKYTGLTISAVGSATETLTGGPGRVLVLSQYPVTAVGSVVVDGTTLTYGVDEDYVWYEDGRLERVGGTWASASQDIVVTYSHGFPSVPEDICGVVLAVAARIWNKTTGDVKQESIGSYSATYAFDEGGPFTAAEKATLDLYRTPVLA